ncbi:MAG: outer membrane protein transport protein [Pseudomonadota bacterium]
MNVIRAIMPLIAAYWCVGLHAGGFSTNGVATHAQSMQSAFVAIADDPSAVFYNPAGVAGLDGDQVLLNTFVIMPSIGFDSTRGRGDATSSRNGLGYSLFATTDRLNALSFGFGVFSPFARLTRYDVGPAVNNVDHSSRVLRVDVAPSVAKSWGNVSVGAGASFGSVTLQSDVLGLREKGSGNGVAFQLGALFKGDRFNVGFSARSPMTARVKGSGTLRRSPAPTQRGKFKADFRFPAMISAGVAYRVRQDTVVSAALDWQLWSSINTVRRRYIDNPILTELAVNRVDADNSMTFRLGVRRELAARWMFTAGYSYTQSAFAQARLVPAFPDFDAHAVSLGVGYFTKRFRVSIGYEFAISGAKVSNNPVFPGEYSLRANNLMLGLKARL